MNTPTPPLRRVVEVTFDKDEVTAFLALANLGLLTMGLNHSDEPHQPSIAMEFTINLLMEECDRTMRRLGPTRWSHLMLRMKNIITVAFPELHHVTGGVMLSILDAQSPTPSPPSAGSPPTSSSPPASPNGE